MKNTEFLNESLQNKTAVLYDAPSGEPIKHSFICGTPTISKTMFGCEPEGKCEPKKEAKKKVATPKMKKKKVVPPADLPKNNLCCEHKLRGRIWVGYTRQRDTGEWIVYFDDASKRGYAETLAEFNANTTPDTYQQPPEPNKHPKFAKRYKRGNTIWVEGTEYRDRKSWVALGFRWAPTKKAWWKKETTK